MSTNHAVFNVIFRFVENYVSPVAGRISSQRHVMAIDHGFFADCCTENQRHDAG